MRLRPLFVLAAAYLLSACAVASVAGSVVSTAVDITGTVASTAVDVVTYPIRDTD